MVADEVYFGEHRKVCVLGIQGLALDARLAAELDDVDKLGKKNPAF